MAKKRTDEEIVSLVHGFVSDSVNARQGWRDKAKRAIDFYNGHQWDDDVKAILEKQGRPALTINHVLPIVGQLCGQQRQAKKDFQAKPRRGGTARAASILSALLKHTCDQTDYEYQAADQFTEGVKTGQGWLWFRPDYDSDPDRGDLMVSVEPALAVFEDPTLTDYNLTEKGKFVVVARWEDKDLVELEVPKARHGELGYSVGATAKTLGETLAEQITGDVVGDGERTQEWLKYRYVVYYAYWRDPVRKATVFDRDADGGVGVRKELTGSEVARVKGLIGRWDDIGETPGRFTLAGERIGYILHSARICGRVVIEYTEDPYNGLEKLPLVRYSPLWDATEGVPHGIIEHLIGPQEEENKRRSQELHHLNQSANSGWMVPKGSLSTEMTRQIKEFGAQPGILVEYDAKKGTPERITPMQISQGHVMASQQAREDMKEISGVNTESLGYKSGSGMSGRALLLQQRQGQTTTEIFFDRFDQSSQVAGELMLEFIQRLELYSDEEIGELLDDEDLLDRKVLAAAAKEVGPQPQPPAPLPPEVAALRPEDSVGIRQVFEESMKKFAAEVSSYRAAVEKRARELMLAELTDLKTARYGCRVVQSANSPTQRIAHFYELTELAKLYPGMIPPDVILQASDLPDKDEIIERMKEAASQQPQMTTQPRPQPPSRRPTSPAPAQAVGMGGGL